MKQELKTKSESLYIKKLLESYSKRIDRLLTQSYVKTEEMVELKIKEMLGTLANKNDVLDTNVMYVGIDLSGDNGVKFSKEIADTMKRYNVLEVFAKKK